MIDANRLREEQEKAHQLALEDSKVENERMAARMQIVRLEVFEKLKSECRVCKNCSERDWLYGDRCDAHETKFQELCAAAQP